jgi:predicted metallopeptidase
VEIQRMSSAQRVTGPRYHVPPFELNWHSVTAPLPLRAVRGHVRPLEAPPWVDTGRAGEPFNFSDHLRRLCADIAAKYEPLGHVDVSRMIFTFTQARNFRVHGLQAKVTPLRFHHGCLTRQHRGVPYQVQQFFNENREILYIVTFCLPRFLNRDFVDKFVTIFHELFHIGPAFDGDLRRHKGRYAVHSVSRKHYDEEMALMAREYLHNGADPRLHDFLRLNFSQLCHRHGSVVGHVTPRPKLIPIRTALH